MYVSIELSFLESFADELYVTQLCANSFCRVGNWMINLSKIIKIKNSVLFIEIIALTEEIKSG